jgi:hypothetical protein
MPAEEERGPGPIDAHLLELMENRLSNKVSERVEQALRWRYGLLAVGIAGAIGFFGWSVKESIDGQINHAVMTAKDRVTQEISALSKEVENTSKATQVSLGVTADQQQRAGTLMAGIEKQLGEFTNKLKTLEQLGEKVDTLEVQRKNIEADLGKAGVGVVTVQNTTEKLADLARQVSVISA